jgi:hypothetical protein
MREKAPSTAPFEGKWSRNADSVTPASSAMSAISMSFQGPSEARRISA